MEHASILICDDSIEEIRVIVSALKRQDYRLIIASNGKEACDRASLLMPSLILMDVRMPHMDGYAACRLLKAHVDTKHIPVIFLTAATDLDDRLCGLRAGAVDYIVKPANEEEVRLRVAAQLSRTQSKPEEHISEPFTISGPRALVRAFLRLLEDCCEDDVDLDDLLANIGTTKQVLNDAFRATTGASFYGWLRDQRMRRACHWLLHSDLSIGQISDDLGYSNSGNFATAFRERYGITPRDFRKLALTEPGSVEKLWQPDSNDLSVRSNPWLILERVLGQSGWGHSRRSVNWESSGPKGRKLALNDEY